MLKQLKLGLFAFMAIAFMAACSNNDVSREQAVKDATAVPADAANAAAPAPGEVNNAPEGPTTFVTWESTEVDFGKVKAGPSVKKEYVFKNTGKEPLIITNVKASCGCTTPDWPKEPIPVGGTGKIVAEFDTKGRSGMQAKQITVTANTVPPQTILYLKGELIGEDAAGSK
jgi:hypothetical protein